MTDHVIDPAGGGDFTTEALALASGSVVAGDRLLFAAGDHVCVGTSHTKANLTYAPLVDGQTWSLKRVSGTGPVLLVYTGFTLDGGSGFVTVTGATTNGIEGNASARTMTVSNAIITGNAVGVYRPATGSTFTNCLIGNNTGIGLSVVSGQVVTANVCAFYGNGNDGFSGAGCIANRCAFYANNGSAGVAQCNLSTTGTATECIAESGTLLGIRANTAVRCSSTNNATGNYSVTTNTDPITGPVGWLDAAGGDFRITSGSPAFHAGQVSAIVTDLAGESYDASTPSIGPYEVPDTTAPVVAITSDAGNTLPAYTLTGTYADASTIARLEYDIDGDTPVGISPIASPFSVPLTLTAGAHTITVEAEDEYGNAGSDSVEVFVDPDAPVVVITSGTTATAAAYTLTGTVTDATTITALVYRLNGGPVTAMDLTDGAFTASLTLREGRNTILVTATDSVGLSGFAVTAVTLTLREAWLPNGARLMSRLTRGLRSAP